MIEWSHVLDILAPLAAGLGAYVAIRADLARVMERATSAKETADQAHRRIDGILSREHP